MGDEKARKSEDLLIESKNFFEFYKKQIGESVRRGNNVIELDFQELAKFSSKLSDEILSYPEDTLRIMELAIEESGLVSNAKVRLVNLPDIDLMKIRNIRSKNINELIAVEGIVRQASDVRPQVVNAKFECPSCLPKGTLIQTPNGLEKIENVKEVYSIDKNFNLIIKKVNVIKTGLKKVIKLNDEISSSLEHKWFVYRNGITKVIQTKNLKIGDILYKVYGKYLCNLQEEYSKRVDKERKENLQLGMQKDTCKSSPKEWGKNKIGQSENNRIISTREINKSNSININDISQIDKEEANKDENSIKECKRTMQNKCKDFIYIQAWKKMWGKRISKISKRELSNKVCNMWKRERFKKEIKCSSQRWQSLQQSNRKFDYPLQFVPYEVTQIDKTTKEIEMYDLQVSDTNNFILSNGIITHNCGTVISVLQMEKKFREPNRCSCGRRGGFKLISKEMVDTQRLVVEESPESLSGGEQPKRLNIFLKDDLVEPRMEEKTTPGSRILAIGILKEVPVPLHSGGLSTRFEIAIEANNLIPLEETFEELKITDEDERQILELSQDPKIFEKLAKSISPSIFGYEEIKRSLVLQLFGGVKKLHVDGSKTRGDIHILLVGDPGVAKSVLLGFMAVISPKGRYVVGKSTSGAGLTATVVRDEYLRGWSLEAGAIVLANKGLVCIDELEKMDPQDRSAMHEAMEQQCMLPDFKLMLANGDYVKIGEFVDNLIEKNKDKMYKGKDCEILPVKNVELLSTDFSSHFKTNATRISRHVAPKEFIKIELTNGREITVTPEHPCWIVKDGKIITIPAEQLNKNMYFPIPSEIKTKSEKYEEKNDYLCKILGYHISDGCYELNRGKKIGIQFWNNDNLLIEDYKDAIENYFKISPIITKRKNQKAVRVISKKVFEELINLETSLLEKGDKKKIPEMIFNLPNENIKYLLRALYDGDGSVIFQKRNGCRISFVSQNKELMEQVSDLLLRFGISSSIFRDKHSKVWRLDISGQENLNKFLLKIEFLSEKKIEKLKKYCGLNKKNKTIADIIPNCTNKISGIFKELKISQRKEIGHSIDLGVKKQRIFLQKLVKIAIKKALQLKGEKGDKIRDELKELEKLAFGYSRWMKIKNVSKIKNKGIKWVYDVTIEPYHTFISNGMILHNTVTISKANVQACYSDDTEVLTEKGWKKYSEVNNLKIAQYNPSAKTIEFLPHKGLYIYDYKGEIYNFKDKRNDILVTPNHTMLIKREKQNEFEKINAEDIISHRFKFVNSGDFKNKGTEHFFLPLIKHLQNRKHQKYIHQHKEKKIPINLWLEFLGYYLSEGGIETKPTIGIVQKKGKNCEKIRKCLKKLAEILGCSLSEIDCQKYMRFKITQTQLYEYLKQFGETCYKKDSLINFSEFSKEQLKIIYDSLMLGDGSSDGKYFSCTSKKLTEDVQVLAHLTGKSASQNIHYKEGSRGNRKTTYRTTISNKIELEMKRKSIKKINYNGKVFCFSTQTGFFVTRRNGKIAIQGNTLRAETSILAAANPKFGRFDPYQSIPQQIDIPPTLINRFDVIFTLRDVPNKDKDELIATHVLEEHQRIGKGMIIPRELFRKYVAYAKQKVFPKLSDEAVKELKEFYVTLRNAPVSSESAMRPIPISARQLTALIRMSEAAAKLRLGGVVTKEDARGAIELMKYYLMQVGYDYETKTFDIDKITTGIATSQRNKIILVRETIARLEARLGKLIPVEEIEQELEGKLSEAEIEDAINKLNTTGDIFKPRRGYVQRP